MSIGDGHRQQSENSIRPYITVVLAMSADGKIADATCKAARFPSKIDKAHLEKQVSETDATLFGAGTLRAYGTTLPITNPSLIENRRSHHRPDQPIHIVCTATGKLDLSYRFFQQSIPRWLLTTVEGLATWRSQATDPIDKSGTGKNSIIGKKQPKRKPFEHILITERPFSWQTVLQDLRSGKTALSATANRAPIKRLLVMGGGELVASLLAEGFVDELYLTICPLLIGGKTAPTPVGGLGFTLPRTPQLTLLSSQVVGNEVFLHYKTATAASNQ